MIRNFFYTFILIFIMIEVDAQLIADKIVAQVGNQIILFSELETQYKYELERSGGNENLKCSILEGLIIENVMLSYATLDSVDVSDEQVEQQLELRMNQILRMMNNDMERLEDFYGQNVTQLKARVRNEMRDQLLIQGKQQQIVGDINVTPAEVISFYNTIPKDSLPLFNSEVEISEIIMRPEVNAKEKKRTRVKLEELKKRIVEGEDFEDIARLYSDDPGSARLGGDLGMMSRGMLVPEFEAAAFSLEEGDLSEIVESDFGFHLIQLLERRGNNIRTRHILLRPELSQEDLSISEEKLREVHKEISSDSISFETAVKKYSDEDSQSYSNGGRIRNPRSGNTFFEIGDLEPDFFFTIDTMDVGQVSTPVEFREVQGDRYFRLIKLLSRTEPHSANLDQDYSKIRNFAKVNKQNSAIAKWIDGKVKEIFIKLDSEYEGCPNLETWSRNKAESRS